MITPTAICFVSTDATFKKKDGNCFTHLNLSYASFSTHQSKNKHVFYLFAEAYATGLNVPIYLKKDAYMK